LLLGVWDSNFVVLGGQINGYDFVVSLQNYTITEIPTQINRQYACASQIPGAKTLWIYGGYDGSQPVSNATALIAYDLSIFNYTAQPPSTLMPVSIGCSCVASKSGFYVFGGQTLEAKYSNLLFKYTTLSGWNVVTPATSTVPGARSFSSLVSFTDVDNNEFLVMFGGGTNVTHNDTWRFNLNTLTWSLDSASGPPARKGHTAVLNDIHALPQMVVFGGSGNSNLFNDLWLYDLTNFAGIGTGIWSQVPSEPAWPVRRSVHGAIFSSGRMLTFGGYNGSLQLDDLWQFVPEVDCGKRDGQCSDCFSVAGCGWCTINRISSCVGGNPISGIYVPTTCTGGDFEPTVFGACTALPTEFDGWWIVLGLIGLWLLSGVVLLLVKSCCDPCPPKKSNRKNYQNIN